MKLTNAVEKLQEKIEAGDLDTGFLRASWQEIIHASGGNIISVGELITHPVIYCDSCGLPSFAGKTKSAYGGAHWICDDKCLEKYGMCDVCRSLVLLDDLGNPTHVHEGVGMPGLLYFPAEQPVAVYNADIMAEGKAKFFKTLQEEKMLAHRKKLSKNPERPFRYFGVEIEVEKLTGGPPDILSRTRKALGQFVMVKRDGSLSRHGNGGFEIVSMPATLGFHKGGIWTEFFKYLGPFFQESPATTGLHIHIGTNTLSPLTIDKLILFVNAAENREFIFAMANRNLLRKNPNGKLYAGVKAWGASDMMRLKQHEGRCPWAPGNRTQKNYYKIIDGNIQVDPFNNPIIASVTGDSSLVRAVCRCEEGRYNIEHYEAVNLRTHRPTVELRIFRGLVNEQFLYACLEFSDSLPDFCAQSPLAGLHYKNYLNFLKDKTKRYHNLYRLLVNQCWIDPPKDKKKTEALTQVPAFGIYA